MPGVVEGNILPVNGKNTVESSDARSVGNTVSSVLVGDGCCRLPNVLATDLSGVVAAPLYLQHATFRSQDVRLPFLPGSVSLDGRRYVCLKRKVSDGVGTSISGDQKRMKMQEYSWNQSCDDSMLGDCITDLPSSSGVPVTQLPIVELESNISIVA